MNILDHMLMEFTGLIVKDEFCEFAEDAMKAIASHSTVIESMIEDKGATIEPVFSIIEIEAE